MFDGKMFGIRIFMKRSMCFLKKKCRIRIFVKNLRFCWKRDNNERLLKIRNLKRFVKVIVLEILEKETKD